MTVAEQAQPNYLQRRVIAGLAAATLAVSLVTAAREGAFGAENESRSAGDQSALVAPREPNTMGIEHPGESMWDKAGQQLDNQGLSTDPASTLERMRAIKALNPGVDPQRLQLGERIVVPAEPRQPIVSTSLPK